MRSNVPGILLVLNTRKNRQNGTWSEPRSWDCVTYWPWEEVEFFHTAVLQFLTVFLLNSDQKREDSDKIESQEERMSYAVDLVRLIRQLYGGYFVIGVAGESLLSLSLSDSNSHWSSYVWFFKDIQLVILMPSLTKRICSIWRKKSMRGRISSSLSSSSVRPNILNSFKTAGLWELLYRSFLASCRYR